MLLKHAISNAFDNFVDYVNHRQENWNAAWDEFCNDIKNFWYRTRNLILDVFSCFKNWFIVQCYPWLYINSGVYPWLDRSYRETWVDCIPEGWRKAFGWKMVRDIDRYLKRHNITDYHIDQVKEKYGELRWYDNSSSGLYHEVIQKYEELSKRTCIICGKPAKYMSNGWISPYCEQCVKDSKKPEKSFSKNPYYEQAASFYTSE